MYYIYPIIFLFIIFLSSCTSVNRTQGGTETLVQLQKLTRNCSGPGCTILPSHTGVSEVRAMALQETATGVGARSGLAWQAKIIDDKLSSRERDLDQTYNFYAMLLHHDILPPVLVEAYQPLNLASPDTIRLAQKVYKIETQAHFVTAPPTWREYLWLNFPQPALPDKTLLPCTHAERRIWNHYVAIGWAQGIKQADHIFDANLARLNRDYKGMILYRKLLAANMVSEPFVAKAELGITGDGNSMRIGDEVLRITALPQLNLKGDTWKAAIVPVPQDHELALTQEKFADNE
jgi:defect-in-organelle-trafficking protein DotC